MRLRSPTAIVGILLAACALCLLGVALAAGGQAKTQRAHLDGEAVGPHRLLVRRRETRIRQRQALAPRRARGEGVRPRVADAQPAKGGLAVGRAVAVSATEIQSQGHGADLLTDSRSTSPAASPTSLPVADESPPEIVPTGPGKEPPPAPPSEAPTQALYWGASIGSQLTGVQAPWDMGAVTRFEQIAGKQVSLVNFFAPFANCSSTPCSFYGFPTTPMERIREYGAIPVFSWSSQSIPSTREEPDFQLGDVIAGAYDSYIREFAEDARDWDHPFFLRFNWEMNGGWFPWAEGANGNRPGEYVAAWRHVHDIFTSVGATNVTWVWCPNVDPDGIFQDLAPLYPGDEYVDWTGLDGYNWGTNPANPDRWRSFDELYDSTYHRVADAIAPDKSMLIGEMGSTEEGGSKAGWIEEALTAIPLSYPKIRGLLWFDTYDSGMDWPIETSASAAGAFAQAIQSPAYVDEGESEPGDGPIPPPDGSIPPPS